MDYNLNALPKLSLWKENGLSIMDIYYYFDFLSLAELLHQELKLGNE